MEEEDDDVSVPCIKNHRSSTSGVSLYQSVQSHLNAGSEQTLYQSVRNTFSNDVGSMSSLNSLHSAISMEDIRESYNDDLSTLNNDPNETIVDGSCTDLRNDREGSSVNAKLIIILPL